MAQPPPPPPPPPPSGSNDGGKSGSTPWPRWSLWILVGVIAASFVLTTFIGGDDGESITYADFMDQVGEGHVESISFDNSNAKISGTLDDGTEFTTTGPLESGIPDDDLRTLQANDVDVEYTT